MDPSRCHIRIYVINNFKGLGQYNTNSYIFFLCFDLSFIKFLIKHRRKTRTAWSQSLDLWLTSLIIIIGCSTEP